MQIPFGDKPPDPEFTEAWVLLGELCRKCEG